jgi:hypothetical protein
MAQMPGVRASTPDGRYLAGIRGGLGTGINIVIRPRKRERQREILTEIGYEIR